jgi:hypothetical protein
MKKSIILLLLFTFSAISLLKAQNENQEPPEEKTGFDKSRLFFGGSFGLSFGDYTLINISPQVGYRLSRYFATGIGINGQYSEFKYRSGDEIYQRQKFGVIGLNIFGRVYPIPQLFAQVQPEMNYVWSEVKNYSPDVSFKENQFVPTVLLGGGGAIPMGRSAAFIIMIQYDILQQNLSPYGSQPFFSIGFNAGF